MSALRLLEERTTPLSTENLGWAPGKRIPAGVTVGGIIDEYQRVVARFGVATAANTADAILENEEAFPNLRAFGPESPEAAYRQMMEQGVRHAYGSIAVLREERVGGKAQKVMVRLLHAVPDERAEGLAYQPLQLIGADAEKRKWLIDALRGEARSFAEKLENVLAEISEIA